MSPNEGYISVVWQRGKSIFFRSDYSFRRWPARVVRCDEKWASRQWLKVDLQVRIPAAESHRASCDEFTQKSAKKLNIAALMRTPPLVFHVRTGTGSTTWIWVLLFVPWEMNKKHTLQSNMDDRFIRNLLSSMFRFYSCCGSKSRLILPNICRQHMGLWRWNYFHWSCHWRMQILQPEKSEFVCQKLLWVQKVSLTPCKQHLVYSARKTSGCVSTDLIPGRNFACTLYAQKPSYEPPGAALFLGGKCRMWLLW